MRLTTCVCSSSWSAFSRMSKHICSAGETRFTRVSLACETCSPCRKLVKRVLRRIQRVCSALIDSQTCSPALSVCIYMHNVDNCPIHLALCFLNLHSSSTHKSFSSWQNVLQNCGHCLESALAMDRGFAVGVTKLHENGNPPFWVDKTSMSGYIKPKCWIEFSQTTRTRRYKEKIKSLGYSEDPFCHLEQKVAHSSRELAGWDGFAQNYVCPRSPSSYVFLGQEASVCFVTLTQYLTVCHKRFHTYPGGPTKIQIVRCLRLWHRIISFSLFLPSIYIICSCTVDLTIWILAKRLYY